MKWYRYHRWLLVACLLFAVMRIEARSTCRLRDFRYEMPEYMITDLLFDERGMLWLCSGNGLRCYDGYNFHHYKTQPGEDNILSSNRINRLWLSHAQGIYCLTSDRNIYLFDIRTERFYDLFSAPEYEEVRNSVSEVYCFNNRTSYIVARNRLFCIDDELLRDPSRREEAIREIHLEREQNGESIVKVVAGTKGKPWVVTSRALSRDKHLIPIAEQVTDVVSIGNNLFLLTEQNRLVTFHADTEATYYEHIPMPDVEAHTLEVVTPDLLAIGTRQGVVLYAVHQRKFTYYDLKLDDNKERNVWLFRKDSYENLWIFGDEEGVIRLHLPTGQTELLQSEVADMPATDRSSLCCFHEDCQGTVWLVPKNGHFCYYDPESQTLKTYFEEKERPSTKIAPILLNYETDHQGNLWYVDPAGLKSLSFHPDNLRYMTFDEGFETRALLNDMQGNLWVASKSSRIRIFRPDGSLRGFLTPDGTITSTPTSFPGNVYCFLQSDHNEIWMGTRTRGLVRLNRTSEDHFRVTRYEHNPADSTSISENAIFAIYRDTRKRLWIGTFGGGLNLMQESDEGKVSFIHARNGFDLYPIQRCDRVRALSETSDAILIGTSEGLLTMPIDFDEPSEVPFYLNRARSNDLTCLPSNNVYAFFRDKEGQQYVVTYTGGISRILSTNTTSDAIRFDNSIIKQGLTSDLVHGMAQDAKGRYWIQLEDGINIYDPDMAHTGRFDERGHHYSEASPVFRGSDLVVTTTSGIAFIDTDKVMLTSYVPPLVFTGLRLQTTQKQRIVDHLDAIELRRNERDITIHFAALDYQNPSAIRYKYRLRGLDERWSEPNKAQTATYTNLPAGRYTFEVRSTNSDGLWVDNQREIAIRVIPTFWETPWPWLIGLLLIVSLVLIFVQIRLKIYRLNSRINLEQQLTNIKLRFFTDVSHELRTPLTLIASPISEVLEHEKLSPKARNHLAIVEQNTQRMLRLVNQILDLRKIESGKMKVLAEECELRPFLQGIVDNFRNLATRNQINYQAELPEAGISGWIDRDKSEKVLSNLLSNAFKYTHTGRGIRLEATIENEWLRLKVIDEGIGMDEKTRERLFRRFETICTTTNFPSSGIGLSMVKELLDLLGGTIAVESTPNVGSCFTVGIPLARAHYAARNDAELILGDSNPIAERRPCEAPSKESKEAQQRTTLLVVEDNDELREVLTDMLASEYHILTARNGAEGLELVRREMPDLILSDVMMPVMDGLEMVRQIKQDRELCHLPIILLTAKSSLDDRIEGLEEGIDDYITKPFVASLLKVRIRTLLERYRQLRERYLQQLIASDLTPHTSAISCVEPQEPHIVSSDEEFMTALMECIERNIDKTEMTIEEFARELNMAHSTFYNKVKALIGITPVEFIREIRLKRGHQLLQSGAYDVSTVCYMVGFSDPRYFSKCFKKRFGISPSQLKKHSS